MKVTEVILFDCKWMWKCFSFSQRNWSPNNLEAFSSRQLICSHLAISLASHLPPMGSIPSQHVLYPLNEASVVRVKSGLPWEIGFTFCHLFFLSTCYVWPSYSNKSSVALKTAFELQKTLCVFFRSCNFLSFKLFVRQCTIFFTQRARH